MIVLNDNLKNKVAVITGGAGVLCSAMAKELARHGVKIAILDLSKERAEETASIIRSLGGTAIGISCNVLETESVKNAEKEVVNVYGGYDILINGAGGNNPRATTTEEIFNPKRLEDDSIVSLYDLDPKGIEFVFDLNFIGTLIPIQIFTKGMINRPGALVINMSSMSAPCPMTKVPAYSAAKAAISNFTMWCAVYLAETGIRVNALAPGFFLTEQNRTLLTNPDGSLTPRSEKIITHTPMRRFGVPEDLLGTVLWLADENLSGFITGITLPIDGGFMAYSGV